MTTLLTVEQYANITQLHPDSVRRQLRSGRLKAIKKGRVWRIPDTAVLEETALPNPTSQWAAAAAEMAPIYKESLATEGDLTNITTAPGAFYETDKTN